MSTEPSAGGGAPTAIADALIGKEIDGCTIVKKIGQGGMGIVYLAEHSKLRQQYVVKILNPALTAAEDTVQRFFREAQSVARLNHHGIVGIQNVGQEGDYYYIRMEFVDGDTVENIIKKEHKLDWKLATKVVMDTSEALSHAHKKGVVHRDIKPENIMLTQQGEVKVMDFGLAKQVQAATKVSVTGQIVGTPFFMSPEQAGGKTVDARSDIYSLGVSYYYMLTGVKPFNGKNLQEIFLKHFFYQPESPKIHTPDVPENVCEIIRRCLKKKKKERYQSAAQLMRDLQAVLEGGELSAPEASDAVSETIAPSSPDFKAPDAGTTARGFVATSSDPSIPLGGDTVSRDVAAAQREIGGSGEPGTIVGKGGNEAPNGSQTVIARGGAASTDEKAAPLTKREGRIQLGEIAGASLVFGAKGAPAPAKPGPKPSPGDAAVKGSPTDSSTPDLKTVAEVTGSAAGTLKKPETVKRPPPKPKHTRAIVLAVTGVLVVGGGIYEVLGMVKFGSMAAEFDRLNGIQPAQEDDAGWTALKRQCDDLATQLESYGSVFRYCPRAESATVLADKCHQRSDLAAKSTVTAFQVKKEAHDRNMSIKEALEKKAQRIASLNKARGDVQALLAAKKWDEAGKRAFEVFDDAKMEGRQAEFKVPVQVTCDLSGVKIYDATTNQELPSLTATPPQVVMAPVSDPTFKLEVRRPKFVTWRADTTFTGYARLTATLERVISHRIDLGKTKPFKRFKLLSADEPAWAVGGMAIDSQNPPTLDVVCQDGTLRSFELKTGRPRWDPQAVGEYGDPTPGPDVLAGKAIATVGADGRVRAHFVSSGAVVAQADLGAPVIAGCCIDSQPSYVVVGTMNGDVVCVDLLNKAQPERWRVRTEGEIATRPLIQGDRVFVGSCDDRLRALDPNTGNVIATYDAREAIWAGPVAQGNTLFVGTYEGRVHAVYVSDFTQGSSVKSVFTTAAAGRPILQLAAVPGKGIFYATDSDLRSADTSTGNKIFEPYTPKADGVPLEIAGIVPMNEAVAVVTINGRIFSVDMKTGAESWSLDLNADTSKPPVMISIPPVFDGTDLYVATSGGEVIALPGD